MPFRRISEIAAVSRPLRASPRQFPGISVGKLFLTTSNFNELCGTSVCYPVDRWNTDRPALFKWKNQRHHCSLLRFAAVQMDRSNQHETERLETPKQLAARVGINERQVRHLVQTRQLEHVMIGSRVHIPAGSFGQFIEAKKVTPCPDETKDQNCGGSQSASAFTSPGPSAAAAASARRARRTANKLKSSSASGCSAEDAVQAQVIRLRSS